MNLDFSIRRFVSVEVDPHKLLDDSHEVNWDKVLEDVFKLAYDLVTGGELYKVINIDTNCDRNKLGESSGLLGL